MTKQVTLNFPCVMTGFYDYHDINEFILTLNENFNLTVEGRDFGWADGHDYVGVLWIGKEPSKKTTDKLFKDAGVEFNES